MKEGSRGSPQVVSLDYFNFILVLCYKNCIFKVEVLDFPIKWLHCGLIMLLQLYWSAKSHLPMWKGIRPSMGKSSKCHRNGLHSNGKYYLWFLQHSWKQYMTQTCKLMLPGIHEGRGAHKLILATMKSFWSLRRLAWLSNLNKLGVTWIKLTVKTNYPLLISWSSTWGPH